MNVVMRVISLTSFLRLLSHILLLLLMASPAKAVEGFWLDQYNAILYLGIWRLDDELKEMQGKGAKVLLVHADSLPSHFLMFIAWRAKEVGQMDSVAWIQKPNKENLKRAVQLKNYLAVQVDDHYFNDPPMALSALRKAIGEKELWCSFQPRQYSYQLARKCDHVDIQIYRQQCKRTGDIAYNLGATGRPETAIAVYHDGTESGEDLVKCMEKDLGTMRTKVFVFKWKNQEAWTKPIWNAISRFSRIITK